MNRRTAIACGIATFLAVGVGCGRSAGSSTAVSDDLYDERFLDALPDVSLDAITERLASRKILVGEARDMLDVDRVRVNGTSDALVEFDGSLYTETELLLYAYVARSHGPRRE